MKLWKRMWLKYQIDRYESFLLEEGMGEAARQGINIQFGGLEGRTVINENIFERIYLPTAGEGKVDATQILELGAKNHPEEAKKYYDYQDRLESLKK